MADTAHANSVKSSQKRFSVFRLAWLAVSRRKRRTIITVILLAFVIGSSITISSTIQQFPAWVSVLSSASSPSTLLTYQRTSPLVGLLPANSTIPLSDYNSIKQISGIEQVTPLIVKDLPTSISPEPSLIVGLDINFWELSLGLNSGHWPEPNSSEAVITVGSAAEKTPQTISFNGDQFQVVGIAVTANLVLVNSVIISYTTAQSVFGLDGQASVFVSQIGSSADPTTISNSISDVDPSLATIDLSTSSNLLSTVSAAISTISNTIVFTEGIFAFAILTALTLTSINSRRWEYGLVSTYGGRKSAFRMLLIENWIVYGLAILPALMISFLVLGYFTYYFNQVFGVHLSGYAALTYVVPQVLNATTLLDYGAAFVAATLGALIATEVVLPKLLNNLLSDSHP